MAKKIIGAALFIFVIFLFCYFRLKPLYFQTVGYTFDQGRDFLKAAEIIRDKNITFIGPTTGIQGLFHGAWYYYLLLIPFLLFRGAPIGFYYFNFLLHSLSLLVLMFFIRKWFGSIISFLIGAVIASSPYFIFTSTFVGNNIIVLPVLIIFIISNYYLFYSNQIKKKYLWFLAGLSVSFVFEFEVAFGLFLIPSYLIILLLNRNTRKNLFAKKRVLPFLIGFIIPLIPRLLFEIKNGFSQIKTIFAYFLKPKLLNPKSLLDMLFDRFNLFWGYAKGLFANDMILYSFLLALFISLLIILFNRKKNNYGSLLFFSLIIIFLFIFSLFYKDNFWSNYYEGIQYLFLILVANILFLSLNKNRLVLIFIILTLLINLTTSLNYIVKDWNNKPQEKLLKSQIAIVDYITTNVKNNKQPDYCTKVYTPPVIPYTYNYLFLYKNISQKIPKPAPDWVNLQCWFIIEDDDFKERRQNWIKANIPKKVKKLNYIIKNKTEVILYEKY